LPRPFWSTLGIEDVVERYQYDAGVVGTLDDGFECRRVLRIDHDGVEPRIDEIVDGRDLRRHVFTGGDDLVLLELGGHFGLRGIGLGRLDHLDAPCIGDVAVGQRNAVRALLGRVLEQLGAAVPGGEATGVGVGLRDNLGRRGKRRSSGQQGGRGRNSGMEQHRSLLC
jgi:hypothetical protein